MSVPLRKQISPTHPALMGMRLLGDDDVLERTDMTNYVSSLITLRGEKWRDLSHECWTDVIGKTVKYACEETGDVDGAERIFARK